MNVLRAILFAFVVLLYFLFKIVVTLLAGPVLAISGLVVTISYIFSASGMFVFNTQLKILTTLYPGLIKNEEEENVKS